MLSNIILNKLELSEQVTTTLWVDCHLEIAKVEWSVGHIEEAIKVLLKVRQVLPPIDTQRISDFTLPFDMSKYHETPIYNKLSEK